MLHLSAIPVTLLTVLRDLQQRLSLSDFALAGGTSLALRFGHRLSVDLDFFTSNPFTPDSLATTFNLGPEHITGQAQGTLQVQIHQCKVEFITHTYPQLAAFDLIDGIRLWSLQDVAAMKLNALVNRGSKKDFYDLAILCDQHPLETLLQFYQTKYRPASLMMVIRSLAWFEDADSEPDPISLHQETWATIKTKIATAIRSLT